MEWPGSLYLTVLLNKLFYVDMIHSLYKTNANLHILEALKCSVVAEGVGGQ